MQLTRNISLQEVSACTSSVQKDLCITQGTDGILVTSSSEKQVKTVAFASQDTDDEEDAMWAQLDDVSTEVLDVPAPPPFNNSLRPIDNSLDRSCP